MGHQFGMLGRHPEMTSVRTFQHFGQIDLQLPRTDGIAEHVEPVHLHRDADLLRGEFPRRIPRRGIRIDRRNGSGHHVAVFHLFQKPNDQDSDKNSQQHHQRTVVPNLDIEYAAQLPLDIRILRRILPGGFRPGLLLFHTTKINKRGGNNKNNRCTITFPGTIAIFVQ